MANLRYEYGRDKQETVVLWVGQYQNDAKEFLETWNQLPSYATRLLHDPRLEGRAGSWQIVADAYIAKTDPSFS